MVPSEDLTRAFASVADAERPDVDPVDDLARARVASRSGVPHRITRR